MTAPSSAGPIDWSLFSCNADAPVRPAGGGESRRAESRDLTRLAGLDRYGNSVWLETGYDLSASLRAALAFLDTPRGRAFAAEGPAADPVARIRANLAELGARLPG